MCQAVPIPPPGPTPRVRGPASPPKHGSWKTSPKLIDSASSSGEAWRVLDDLPGQQMSDLRRTNRRAPGEEGRLGARGRSQRGDAG